MTEVDPEQEFTPTQAFVHAMDDAIRATTQCLADTGMSEQMIWEAFRQALTVLQRAAIDVDNPKVRESEPSTVAVP